MEKLFIRQQAITHQITFKHRLVLSLRDMKKILLSLLITTAAQVHADYSEPFGMLDETALQAVDDFIPADWKAIALAQGDLNDDQLTDYALVIQKTDPANIHSSEGLITGETDANPRHLLLLFANPAGEDKAAEQLNRKRLYRRFIPSLNPEYPNLAEPFSYIAINEGILEVKFEVWATAGSWERDDLTFKFQYNKDSETFPLISFDHRNVHKATGMFKDVNIDLVKNTMNKAAGSMSSPKHKKENSDFIPAQEWTPCSIKEPLVFYP